MRKILTFILILCTVALFAEMRGGSQYDPGAARSNLTNITSGSALGVANGGTGKTTAAEALAALGGASLNGSSTVDFSARAMSVASKILIATSTDDGANKLQVNGGAKISGSLKTALSGGASTGYKIQNRAVGAASVATYTICTFQSLTGNEKFAYYGDILVCGVNGAEAYKVYVGGTANAGNTAIAMDAATVTATTLNGAPADIIASYSVVGVAGTITIHVPQTYHTMTMRNMWADTRLAPCVWAE